VAGDIVKFDDNGLMMHMAADSYSTIPWAKFSQDALKQLSANPKLKPLVEPFIEPTAAERPPKPEIKVNPVTRLERPEHASIFGGLVHSSLGWFILLVVYAANLYAAFEIAVVRGKPVGAAIGLSAVLPLIGPVFFLTQPVKAESAPEEPASAGAPVIAAAPGSPPAEAPAGTAPWQPSPEEKKPQPQVFARGKFTFNKRFIETKFAGFIGEPKGDAKTFAMEIRTSKKTIAVGRIMQVGATETILETPGGRVAVPFADIQEIKLNPRTV